MPAWRRIPLSRTAPQTGFSRQRFCARRASNAAPAEKLETEVYRYYLVSQTILASFEAPVNASETQGNPCFEMRPVKCSEPAKRSEHLAHQATFNLRIAICADNYAVTRVLANRKAPNLKFYKLRSGAFSSPRDSSAHIAILRLKVA